MSESFHPEVSERTVEGIAVFGLRIGPGQRDSIAGFHKLISDRLNAGHSKFIINLAECSWIDSKSLGELVRALVAVMRQGGSLKVVEMPSRVRTIFEMTNLTQVFDVFETENEAIRSYGIEAN